MSNIEGIIKEINDIIGIDKPGSKEFFEKMIGVIDIINTFMKINRENEDYIYSVNKILQDILKSMENKDYILTQDLLEYELIDVLLQNK